MGVACTKPTRQQHFPHEGGQPCRGSNVFTQNQSEWWIMIEGKIING